jgi:hypothetical protein
MDFTKADQQVVDNILQSKVIKDKAIVKPTEFTGTNDADIEDLFDADTYIALVTAAYPHVNVTAATLPPGTRLVKRVEKVVLGGKVKKFNHFLPSKHITDYLDKKGVPDDVLDRFEKLFERVNKLG